jgi:hypothetical protein
MIGNVKKYDYEGIGKRLIYFLRSSSVVIIGMGGQGS